jgi:CheY-like chemotaxis protein
MHGPQRLPTRGCTPVLDNKSAAAYDSRRGTVPLSPVLDERMPEILLVEDDPTSRYLMATMLTEMGYIVTSAASGDEALQFLYSEESCDVLFADIVLPGMSGIELARRTREARPGLPTVLVTGRTEGWKEAIDAGALALPKPVSRERLEDVLADALQKRRAS